MYNTGMSKQIAKDPQMCEPAKGPDTPTPKRSSKLSYSLGIAGIILTVAMAVAIIVFKDSVQELKQYGYVGAFFISILGGATVIVPVPMIAVVFALGGAMADPWQVALVGVSAALGETVGALTIYMTGQGAGRAISNNKHGRVQKYYEKMLDLIERRGAWALFVVTSIVNPFFYPAAFACGALRFGLKKYITIVLIGKMIKSMTVVYAGYFGLKGIFHAIGIDI
jgi:membrane protein DedA with SNARE-associated domain